MTRRYERISVTVTRGVKDEVLKLGLSVSGICNEALKQAIIKHTMPDSVLCSDPMKKKHLPWLEDVDYVPYYTSPQFTPEEVEEIRKGLSSGCSKGGKAGEQGREILKLRNKGEPKC